MEASLRTKFYSNEISVLICHPGDLASAQRLYERLVASEVVTELRSLAEAAPDLKHPLKNITYSAFKNLAKIVADADQA